MGPSNLLSNALHPIPEKKLWILEPVEGNKKLEADVLEEIYSNL